MIRLWVKLIFLEELPFVLYFCSLNQIGPVHLADCFMAVEATTLLTVVHRGHYTSSVYLVKRLSLDLGFAPGVGLHQT